MIKQTSLDVRKDSGIAILTFNRPVVYNALDTEVGAVVIAGTGKAFIAGSDIAEMSQKTPAQTRAYSELGHILMHTIEQLDKPVIAAINGFCLGGGMEVALVSDIRIASKKARFGLSEAILGITLSWGALP